MSKKLYLECYSGISGDMTVAALLDLGADADVLDKALKSLPLTGFETCISRVTKSGIDACDFNVILEHDNHDHDMEYLYGEGHHHQRWFFLNWFHRHHDHDHSHAHGHSHSHSHSHGHSHTHGHSHDHDHEHRGLADIVEILNGSALTDRAKKLAVRIFQIIAEAESKAHGLPVEEVHFHEVGAVDSIVDIAAVAVCLDNLDITEVIVPVLYEGTGTVRCQHGVLPIPVPAVVNIANAHGLYLTITSSKGEFVTPTGAAIVAAIRTADTLPASFRIVKTGLGAGKRNYDRPSFLRAMLIEENAPSQVAEKSVLSTTESSIPCKSQSADGASKGTIAEETISEEIVAADYEQKKKTLEAHLLELAESDIVVAFSGGVDSSLLLMLCCKAAREKGTKVTAVTMLTRLHPHGDEDIARRVAEEAGACHVLMRLDELEDAGIRMNPEDRCYRCKRLLFGELQKKAAEIGATCVIEGTNADDLHVYRPGIRVLRELGIRSPLAECGITKSDVRQMAQELGLSVARRASTPCMATRFPYNTLLDYEAMARVDEAERWLREQGFYNVRLRVHGDIARLEIDHQDMGNLHKIQKDVVNRFKTMGFAYVTLDLEGFRSGSMDIHIKKKV